MAKRWIACDFDGCIRSWETNQPIDGAKEALAQLRERGYKVIIHSCNNPSFIAEWLQKEGIRYDAIWGDSPGDKGHKPFADAYIDDAAVAFRGDWDAALQDTLALLER